MRLLLGIAALALLWAAALVVSGGFDVTLAGRRLRTHEPMRPLVVAGLALAACVPLYGTARTHARWSRLTRRLQHGPVALALALFVSIVGLSYSTTAAAGPDAYGYVSQAELWRHGTPHLDQPWAAEVPWPAAGWTFSPLGTGHRTTAGRQSWCPPIRPGCPF